MEPRFSRFCNTLFQGGESIFPCPVSPSSWATHPKKFFWRYLNAGIKPTATCIPEHSGYLGQFCLVRRGGCAITKGPVAKRRRQGGRSGVRLRFENKIVFENIESVLETIREVLREVDTKATHPVRAASERVLFLMA